MMASPVALPRPALPCPCLTKKLTVIGTIGQTQGITSANRPPSAEAIRNGINPCSAFWAISLRDLDEDPASDGRLDAGGVAGTCDEPTATASRVGADEDALAAVVAAVAAPPAGSNGGGDLPVSAGAAFSGADTPPCARRRGRLSRPP